ncbi:MGMT family protein [Halostella litorea]|uniref:MGMT family protein n=1 Tax=Halostella litorea TaxID=2528831 RepID=UPI0010924D57|nr:MGMT family protein [Halostella litorea]
MEDAGIYARESPYLDRHVQVGVASGRVVSVSFPEDPADDAEGEHELLDRIFAYLEGQEDDFADVRVALTVPTDRRSVLETVRDLPYGEGVTVQALARMTPGLDAEADEDLRLVRSALADNPAPLLIPDHRVGDGPSAAPPAVEQRLRSLEGL